MSKIIKNHSTVSIEKNSTVTQISDYSLKQLQFSNNRFKAKENTPIMPHRTENHFGRSDSREFCLVPLYS